MIKLVNLELFQCITYSIQWIAQNSRFRKDAVSSAFWSVSGNLFQKVGAVLRKYLAPECLLFAFSPNPEVVNLHWKEERRERDGLYGGICSCKYCGTVLYTHGLVCERKAFVLNYFGVG